MHTPRKPNDKEPITMPMSKDVRRVVTTVDKNDKAIVLFDGANPHTIKRPDRPTTSRLLWVTGETPADISGPADRAALAMGKLGINPPPGGTVFRIVEFPPIGPDAEKLGNDHMHHQIGGDAPKRG